MFTEADLRDLARRSAAGQSDPEETVYVIAALIEERQRSDRLADGLVQAASNVKRYRDGLEYLAAAFASVKSRPAPRDVVRFVRSTLGAPERLEL